MFQSSVRLPRVFIMGMIILSLAMAFMFTPFAQKASASVSWGQEVTEVAKLYKGAKYKWGGTTPAGFDASGFTQFIYKKSAAKMSLPRTAKDQYKAGKAVSQKNLKEGDLVFFKTNGKDVSFVGIYLGSSKFIGATSQGVREQSLTTKYWKDRYVGAKHLLP
ncbi:C40 family peptidase [Peribacillus kribbensis]|uniref:C40 family peptidase n=1 Tax=Peribacillus kribbensis TaxID=356658 RepID=UPI0003FF84E8|nr:C40 family peptidase [Peribacillus kribbensis]